MINVKAFVIIRGKQPIIDTQVNPHNIAFFSDSRKFCIRKMVISHG